MKGIIYTKDIYREIVPKIIQDEASWSSFLNFSAVHYQMGFENASLLYAQRPDAKMVETYSGWREKGRYVRRGSKGIAIIDSSHYRPYVDHVFDIPTPTGGEGRRYGSWIKIMKRRYFPCSMQSQATYRAM